MAVKCTRVVFIAPPPNTSVIWGSSTPNMWWHNSVLLLRCHETVCFPKNHRCPVNPHTVVHGRLFITTEWSHASQSWAMFANFCLLRGPTEFSGTSSQGHVLWTAAWGSRYIIMWRIHGFISLLYLFTEIQSHMVGGQFGEGGQQ